MKTVKKKRRYPTKVRMPKFNYKKSCDVCKRTTKQTTIWSYVGRKTGRVRGACKKHLKKVN